MKKTMFKRIFAGIAAMFMMCLFLPMCSMEFMPNAKRIAEAEDEWLDMYGIEYKIKDRDTLIINDNSDAHIVLNGYNFKTYSADIKHLQIGNGWKIYNFSYLTAIESLTIGDNCNIGASAFLECTSLTSVKIGKGCTVIMYAFDSCTSLTNVAFGYSCTIEKWAFNRCNSIQKVSCMGDKNTVTVDYNNHEIICNKDKWTIITGTLCPKCYGNAIDFKCESCGYFDKAAAQAEIDRIQKLIDKNESDNNTASTISTGNPLILLFGGIAVIIGSVAAAIIVKRMKKAE